MNELIFISPPRLQTYLNVTTDKERAIELHNATMQLGSSLLAVIAQIELALRNSIDELASKHFGTEDWLRTSSIQWHRIERDQLRRAENNARRSEYSKLSERGKSALDALAFPKGISSNQSHEQISRARMQTINVSPGQLVAQTTIHFWKRLMSAEYQEELWKPCLKKVFPDKKIDRAAVSIHLEQIYAARNRIAHHEPVYGEKLANVFNSIKYVRSNLGRRGNMKSGPLESFTEIQFYRLYTDYAAFRRTWNILKD